MKNLFIPYELAVLAKEKGFNEHCIGMYLENKNLYSLSNPTSDFSWVTNENRQDTFAAPLYQQIVDWFRDKHNIIVDGKLYSYSINSFQNNGEPKFRFQPFVFSFKNGQEGLMELFETKKEAENIAILEAFKLI